MNKQLNITVCALLAIATASSVGCNSGFKSGSSGASVESASSNGGVNDQVAKAQAAVSESQKAMESASIALNGMNGASGTIDLNIFEPQNGGVLAPIIAKLQPIFDQVFSKVQMAKAQFDASKAAIAAELAKLDPADPMYKLLSEELAQLTKLETQFDTQVQALANRLTLVNSQIDALIAKATAYIPIPGLSILAGLLIDTFIVKDVKDLISSLHDKLMAL